MFCKKKGVKSRKPISTDTNYNSNFKGSPLFLKMGFCDFCVRICWVMYREMHIWCCNIQSYYIKLSQNKRYDRFQIDCQAFTSSYQFHLFPVFVTVPLNILGSYLMQLKVFENILTHNWQTKKVGREQLQKCDTIIAFILGGLYNLLLYPIVFIFSTNLAIFW